MNKNIDEPVTCEVARAIALAGGPASVARHLGLSTQTVCFYRDGARRLNTDHAAALEALAGGLVTRQQMWPSSWHRIWPELSKAKKPAAMRSVKQEATNV